MKDTKLSPGDTLTEEAISTIVKNKLPAWKKACDAEDVEFVTFNQFQFGTTTDELLLMAIAIKYANLKGKEVKITADTK